MCQVPGESASGRSERADEGRPGNVTGPEAKRRAYVGASRQAETARARGGHRRRSGYTGDPAATGDTGETPPPVARRSRRCGRRGHDEVEPVPASTAAPPPCRGLPALGSEVGEDHDPAATRSRLAAMRATQAARATARAPSRPGSVSTRPRASRVSARGRQRAGLTTSSLAGARPIRAHATGVSRAPDTGARGRAAAVGTLGAGRPGAQQVVSRPADRALGFSAGRENATRRPRISSSVGRRGGGRGFETRAACAASAASRSRARRVIARLRSRRAHVEQAHQLGEVVRAFEARKAGRARARARRRGERGVRGPPPRLAVASISSSRSGAAARSRRAGRPRGLASPSRTRERLPKRADASWASASTSQRSIRHSEPSGR